MAKIAMNPATKLKKQIHDLKGVIGAYERSGHKRTAAFLRDRLRRLESQLESIPPQRDDGVRFLGVGWVKRG